MSKSLRWIPAPIAALACFILDYISKRWAENSLVTHESIAFIPGFLNLNLTTNTGAAFSIGKDSFLLMTILASTVTLVLLGWYISRERDEVKPSNLERIGLGLIIGGALGNLVDRFSKGSVTDFLEFAFIEFPVFNTADALIDVGIGLVIISIFLAKNDPQPAENEVQSNSSLTDHQIENQAKSSELRDK